MRGTRYNTYNWLIAAVLVFFYGQSPAQDQIGIAQGNFHVTEGNRINPSFGVDAKPWLDVHIGGFYGYFTNNYASLSNQDVNLYRFRRNFEFSVNEDPGDKFLNSEGRIEGPGFSMVVDRFYFGFASAARYMAMARDVPLNMAQNYWFEWAEDSHVGESFNNQNFRIKQAAWSEYAFQGGYMVRAKGKTIISVGGAFKYLRGMNHGNFLVDNFDYSVPDENTFQTDRFNGTYSGTPFTQNSGNGFGMDLGFTYKRTQARAENYQPHNINANCRDLNYHYRIGVSAIDLGFVNYRLGLGTRARTVQNGSAEWDRTENPIRIDDYGLVLNDLDNRFINDVSESDEAVRAWLPAAISAQFDYNLQYNRKGTKELPNWYVNVSAMYGLPAPNTIGTERTSWLAVTPRYETPRFDLSMPVSVTSRGTPHVGVGVRYWVVSFGLTNLIPIIGAQDNYHFGGYFHLKWTIFNSPQCKTGYKAQGPEWRVDECNNPKVSFPRLGGKKRRKMKKKQKRYLE